MDKYVAHISIFVSVSSHLYSLFVLDYTYWVNALSALLPGRQIVHYVYFSLWVFSTVYPCLVIILRVHF